jgi:hypothetical protein
MATGSIKINGRFGQKRFASRVRFFIQNSVPKLTKPGPNLGRLVNETFIPSDANELA